MNFTQKEMNMLQELKSQEQICHEKYAKYAADACDGQLKNLFSQLGQVEYHHYETINQILSGTVPQMSGGSSSQSAQATYNSSCNNEQKQKDKYLCSDALATEKYVSSVYDTSIFEFRDTNIRDILNHIQKEEQGHGEKIYNYMSQNGMYN